MSHKLEGAFHEAVNRHIGEQVDEALALRRTPEQVALYQKVENQVIDAFINGANDAFTDTLRQHMHDIGILPVKICRHEVLGPRDLANMSKCVACGREFGPGFLAWESAPTGPYMGISREGIL